MFSVSNCGITSDPFQLKMWMITQPSPGQNNLFCFGGIPDTKFPTCHSESAIFPPHQESQEPEDSSCSQVISDMIIENQSEKLQAIYSRELTVTGNNNMVTGTYFLIQEPTTLFDKPVYLKEGNTVNAPNAHYIFHKDDNHGWRIGYKSSISRSSGYIDGTQSYYSKRYYKFKISWARYNHISSQCRWKTSK